MKCLKCVGVCKCWTRGQKQQKPKRLRKPRPLKDKFGHTLAEIIRFGGIWLITVKSSAHSANRSRRLAAWLVRAAAWLEQQKGEK